MHSTRLNSVMVFLHSSGMGAWVWEKVDSVILVTLSLAGMLAQVLSIRLRARLKRCVFVGAVIPLSGNSYVDTLGFAHR